MPPSTDARVLDLILSGRPERAMSFDEKVWALTCRVPAGKVTTYAAIARRLRSKAYRAVGSAMHRNPHAPRVPCHRVVGSDGRLTGYAGGLAKKRRMLQAEGVLMRGDRVAMDESFIAV